MAGFKNGALALKKKDIGINADPNFINILVDTSNNLYTIDEFGVYRSVAGYDIISSGSDISVVTSGGTKILSLNSTSVVSGTYGTSTSVPQIVVDNKGRILSAYNIPISASGLGTVTSISISSSTLKVINSPITTFGTFGVNLSATGVISGSILKPFVDSYGRVLSGGLISATDISDRSTDVSLSANSDNKIPTEKAIRTYVDTKRLYISTGISVDPPPNFVNNNDGTLTIEPTTCRLYSTTDFTGSLNEYNIAGTTLALTDGIEQHVCIKYNAGSPIYYVENSDSNINDSNVICVYIVWRQGLEIHSLGMDSLGLGLGNKTLHAINNTTPYKKSYLGGLVISETSSPTSRTIIVTSGDVYAGVIEQPVLSFNSSVDRLTLTYHNSGVWNYSDTSAYNNIQYDNGTNLVTIPNNKYSVRWFYRSVGDVKQTFYVLGSGSYNNISDARLELPRTNLPLLLLRHCILVGRSIIQHNATSGITEPVSDVIFSQLVIQNHNDLGNIQGGDPSGNYFHISASTFGYLSAVSADIQSQINSKITTSVISAYLPLSGGLMSANAVLSFQNSSGTNIETKIYNNFIGFRNILGGTPFTYFASSGLYDMYLRNEQQPANLNVDGNISANSFVKSGGTSTQFLKANGSVDSTVYATNASLANYLPLIGGTLTGLLNGTNISANSISAGNISLGTWIPNPIFSWLGYKTHNNITSGNSGFLQENVGNIYVCAPIGRFVNIQINSTNIGNFTSAGLNVVGNVTATTFIGNLNGYKNVDNINEATISNGYNDGSGQLYLNFRGTLYGISQYRMCNGLGSGVLAGVLASAFVKSGGTSTQFLKADGSSDSTSYATTASINRPVNEIVYGTGSGITSSPKFITSFSSTWNGVLLNSPNTAYASFFSLGSNSNTSSTWSIEKRDAQDFGTTLGCFTIEDSLASADNKRFPVVIDAGSAGDIKITRNLRGRESAQTVWSKDIVPTSVVGNANFMNAPLVTQRIAGVGDYSNVAGIGFHNIGVNGSMLYYDSASSNFMHNNNAGGIYTLWDSRNLVPEKIATYGNFIDHGTIGQYTYVGFLPNNGAATRESLTVKLYGGHWGDVGGCEVVFNAYGTPKAAYKQRMNNNSVNWYAYLNGGNFDFYVIVGEDAGWASFGVESVYYSAAGRTSISNYFQTSSPTGTLTTISWGNYNSGDIRWNSFTNNITSYGSYYVSNYAGGGSPAIITNQGNGTLWSLGLEYVGTGNGALRFSDFAYFGATYTTSIFDYAGKTNCLTIRGYSSPSYSGLCFGTGENYIGCLPTGVYFGSSSKDIYLQTPGTLNQESGHTKFGLVTSPDTYNFSSYNYATFYGTTQINRLKFSPVQIVGIHTINNTAESFILVDNSSGTITVDDSASLGNVVYVYHLGGVNKTIRSTVVGGIETSSLYANVNSFPIAAFQMWFGVKLNSGVNNGGWKFRMLGT